jgi:signal peptidase I
MKKVLDLCFRALALVTAARVKVTGWSMYPTLAPGEYVLFVGLAYWRGKPARGDVVLTVLPHGDNRRVIKRVVAVPGDILQAVKDRLLVNGVPLEAQVPGTEEGPDPGLGQDDQWVLNADEYFLLGDARDLSTDSRSFGPVSRKAILARAWLVYWPTSRWRSVHPS